jgi:hypothetical protein
MYVKLVSPRNKATQVLRVPCGDVHYKLRDPMNSDEVDAWHDGIVDAGWESRHFIAWPNDGTESIALTEITIPGAKANQTQVVLTNWDGYLVHESGRTVDRIHRHLPKPIEE